MSCVVICLKNCTFVVSTTTRPNFRPSLFWLWFAWKIVPLWCQQQRRPADASAATRLWFAWKIVPLWCQQQQMLEENPIHHVVICLKNCTFVVSTTITFCNIIRNTLLWFAWKIVPLWCQQQHLTQGGNPTLRCDLLEKLYLCGVNNNALSYNLNNEEVVICLKNCTFVVSTTTKSVSYVYQQSLWFAWKIVPLWCQQQLIWKRIPIRYSCDLLEKSYLCGVNNNHRSLFLCRHPVVICLKNRTFVVSTTTAYQ